MVLKYIEMFSMYFRLRLFYVILYFLLSMYFNTEI